MLLWNEDDNESISSLNTISQDLNAKTDIYYKKLVVMTHNLSNSVELDKTSLSSGVIKAMALQQDRASGY